MKATGRDWIKTLAEYVALRVEDGLTVVTVADDGTIAIGKQYKTATAAFGQRTKRSDEAGRAFVVIREGDRVRLMTGPMHRLFEIDANSVPLPEAGSPEARDLLGLGRGGTAAVPAGFAATCAKIGPRAGLPCSLAKGHGGAHEARDAAGQVRERSTEPPSTPTLKDRGAWP